MTFATLKKYRWPALFLLIVATLPVWKVRYSTSFPREIAFEGGGGFRVHYIGYGTNQFYPKPTKWNQFLGKLPLRFRPYSYRKPNDYTGSRECLMLVYEEFPTREDSQGFDFHWVDSDGLEAKVEYFDTPTADRNLKARLFSNFPRRSKELKLRFFTIDYSLPAEVRKRKILGEMVLRNPATAVTPPLLTLPLPQTQMVGKTKVTLQEVTWGPDPDWDGVVIESRWQSRSSRSDWTTLKLNFSRDGSFQTNWGVQTIHCEDGFGNHFEPRIPHYRDSWKGDTLLVWMNESLWPSEPVKYRLIMAKNSDFDPEDIITFPNIPVPKENGYSVIGFTTNVLGEIIGVDGIANSGVVPPWSSKAGWTNYPGIYVVDPAERKGVYFRLLSVIDDESGHDLKVKDQWDNDDRVFFSGARDYYPGGSIEYKLDLSKVRKSVTVKIAIHKSFTAEFITQPRIIKDPKKPR